MFFFVRRDSFSGPILSRSLWPVFLLFDFISLLIPWVQTVVVLLYFCFVLYLLYCKYIYINIIYHVLTPAFWPILPSSPQVWQIDVRTSPVSTTDNLEVARSNQQFPLQGCLFFPIANWLCCTHVGPLNMMFVCDVWVFLILRPRDPMFSTQHTWQTLNRLTVDMWSIHEYWKQHFHHRNWCRRLFIYRCEPRQIWFGGVLIPLIFPKVPQSSLGILRVLQLPPPLGHPGTTHPLRTLTDLRNDKDLGVSVIDGQSFLLVTRISDGAISILDQTGSKGKLIIFSMCQTGKRSRNTICIWASFFSQWPTSCTRGNSLYSCVGCWPDILQSA